MSERARWTLDESGLAAKLGLDVRRTQSLKS